ncbi:MAG: hypothetical protein ABSG68_18255, partial [Thermoguttaceae bacterium]
MCRITGCRLRPTMLVLLVLSILASDRAQAVDRVTFRRDGKQREVTGRVVVSAQDGGLLLLARDGVLWNIVPEEQIAHVSDAAPFRPLTAAEMSHAMLSQLPKGFDCHGTAH